MDTYTRIAHIIEFLATDDGRTAPLSAVAERAGFSPFHFQRLFVEWVGISPKDFQQALTLVQAKQLLAQRIPVLDAALASGLSGPSRMHDLFVGLESMTPGEYRDAAASLHIRWSFEATPFGRTLFASTGRGLCRIAFVDDETQALDELRAAWPGAQRVAEPAAHRRGGVAGVTARRRDDARHTVALQLRAHVRHAAVLERSARLHRFHLEPDVGAGEIAEREGLDERRVDG